jgi:hypothetical protein
MGVGSGHGTGPVVGTSLLGAPLGDTRPDSQWWRSRYRQVLTSLASGSLFVSIRLPICVSVCLSVRPSVGLPACLPANLSVRRVACLPANLVGKLCPKALDVVLSILSKAWLLSRVLVLREVVLSILSKALLSRVLVLREVVLSILSKALGFCLECWSCVKLSCLSCLRL